LDSEVLLRDKGFLRQKGLYERTLEKDHGRIEIRECFLCPDIDWLPNADKWAGLSGIGVILSQRQELGKEPSFSRHYFLYSLRDTCAAEILRLKRSHWAIENSLHWLLDVAFREDDSRARRLNAAENLNILRKHALQLMKNESSVTGSMRSKRLRCAWDPFYAFKVIGVN
jgi:hypothetical protein